MILVVDDDPDVLDQAARILNRDRQVFLASTGKQAMDIIGRVGFSVVLVDLEMEGEPYTLIQRLHDAHPDLMIIGTTGALHASLSSPAKSLGIVEVLRKPVTPEWKPVVERIRARKRV